MYLLRIVFILIDVRTRCPFYPWHVSMIWLILRDLIFPNEEAAKVKKKTAEKSPFAQ